MKNLRALVRIELTIIAILALLSVSERRLRVKGEVFTSMVDMEAMLKSEGEVVEIVNEYIKAEKKRLQQLKQYARAYAQRAKVAARGGQITVNPLNSFLTLKHLTTDWNYLEQLMKQNAAESFLKNVAGERSSTKARALFPTEEDLEGSAAALLRIQDIYQIDTPTMAKGLLPGVKAQADGELTAHDCFEIGKSAYNAGDNYHTIEWMTEAKERLAREQPITANEADILEYLSFALYLQGNLEHALFNTEKLIQMVPDHPRAETNAQFYRQALKKNGRTMPKSEADLPPIQNPRQDEGNVKDRHIYEALCRGETFPSKNYFLRIAPVKAERVHVSPDIIVFRNFLSDAEVSLLKDLALPKLNRALIQNPKTGVLEAAHYRTSKNAWLKPTDHEVVARIDNRMAAVTGLSMETAEELQIANYGLGGHYEPHFDFAMKNETGAFERLGAGNRIATMLFYLSQPEAGGATVFPDIRFAVFPTVNDAIFWYNLFQNGDGDELTRHAACPVLAGIKWVANKWIHEFGQEFRRPCDLDQTL